MRRPLARMVLLTLGVLIGWTAVALLIPGGAL